MEYIVGIVLIVIIAIIIALVLRRRLYNAIDHLERMKVDIMNRNIAAELSRMKELNLTGETLESFNKWKDRWELILTEDLANVEVQLFDAEAYADRYKFNSSREELNKIEEKINEIDIELESIITQLNDLLETEEASRKGVEELRPAINDMAENLIENKELYGRGVLRFKIEFEELTNGLITYDDLVENGEYHQAKEVVEQVNKELKRVQVELEEYPELYKKCKFDLPQELNELIKGIREMKSSGYPVEHLGFEEKIKTYQKDLLTSVRTMEKRDLESSKEVIPEIQTSIEVMYDSLEKEVEGRELLEVQLPVFRESLNKFAENFTETQAEVEILREAYHFATDDLEKNKKIERSFEELQTLEESLSKQFEEKSEVLSKLGAKLEGGLNQLEQLEIDHQVFSEHIQMLRKDEIEARDHLQKLRQELISATRQLRTNNLPGVPDFIWKRINDAEAENEKVIVELSKTPLDIKMIQNALANAETSVNVSKEEIKVIIEQAYLTERVIQYANRYRSSNNNLARELAESEKSFRDSEYELALETAAAAIESVEPGALKKIEEQQQYS